MAKRYKLELNTELCKNCGLCIAWCPKNVLAVVKDKINSKGYPYVEAVSPDECIGCCNCTAVCPDCVIEIIELNEDSK
ncbi:MAG: 4Fe-4S dicluster domain-containing protein [Kiritimatiellae bacterium]|nr:4Fe-4S dicluster domain-containing protein [Kiritimatiellia bacterium]